mgnify:CR=1 FL=1
MLLEDDFLQSNTNRAFARLLPTYESEAVDHETKQQLHTRLEGLLHSGIITATVESALETMKRLNGIEDIEPYRAKVTVYANQRYTKHCDVQREGEQTRFNIR